MSDFGFYEWFVILIISGAPTFVLIYLAIKALPGVVREISVMWYAPDPNNKHNPN